MTRDQLHNILLAWCVGRIPDSDLFDAVEAYSSASNGSKPNVSDALPLEIEDACIKFGIYVYAHNCNVDESEVAVELVKEDYHRYLAGRQ